MSECTVQIKNLHHKYNKLIFKQLNVNFESNKHIGLRGGSGEGKSSLFNLILGIESIQSGQIMVFGQELNSNNIVNIRSRIAWLPQNISDIGCGTVFETLIKPFSFEVNKSISPNIIKIKNLFDKLSLNYELLESNFNDLSVGEKQRIGLIIAILLERELILLDEPSSAMDVVSTNKALLTLAELKNTTIISLSHNDTWLNACDYIFELQVNNLEKK